MGRKMGTKCECGRQCHFRGSSAGRPTVNQSPTRTAPFGLSDIWRQPLDGSPPKQLTNFKAERILAFDWSRDGRSLAFVRNVETRDVVLIGNASLK
jgi:hypothetical protein